MENLVLQALSGLASASSLFLVASGLTVIFGVSRVVNFAHGSLYMLGAYLAYSLVTTLPRGHLGFWGGVIGAAVLVGLIGLVVEVLLLRRIYRAPELFQLLATFGVVLIVQDLAQMIWGPQDLLGPRAPGLRGSIEIVGMRFPLYELFLIGVGPVVLGLLVLLFHRTRWGTLVRAATQDREMVGALGVNQRMLFTSVFFLGSLLAGLGGALQLPRESVNLHMDLAIITEAFVVVVVGGLGSLTGAALAALLIGELHAFGILIVPKITLVLVFLVMALVLVVRPHGLLGKPEAAARGGQGSAEPVIGPAPPALRWLGLATLAVAVVLPPFLGDYAVSVLTELAIAVLFAASLHLIMGPGGMASFGNAAYFGIGAYGAALAAQWLGAPMLAGLALAPLAAGVFGLLFGYFCVRLSGVYAAMLTLAFAQIAWSVAFQWVEVTGGDNGILGVWPSAWAAPKLVYYYLALALCLGATLFLRRVVHAPFGYALRAQRDSALRAEAIGIDAFRIRWLGFGLAAAAAGVAGGLFAYGKGSVFPTYMGIPRSVDALLMVLLGGVQTLSGPIVGALAFTGLQEQLVRITDLWRLILGCIIVLLVLFFPQGLAGAARARWEARHGDA
ncbi:MAG: ABC transporter, permease protein 1 (cluster 4, leucine/isoleucine/valine/benzoate) / ABC transporter, permease protein 2 (cluster 4, leucine/isoleucine/valine/benzoate) [uncultured Craurococcus sp.]|uniref:ABC transporter, permease protein 1 (Cluster 4, leucine/isoleucine/valine/benzoate) / ABC transporter, permease protein 2 (Cluster 4, leucine/isoleucine/valine/benzoate) n=1 Tax=uncultured Craurococcus sp. TaxID=1135998 RepID=A0A6J4IZ29_9PROT|nr:MAG: ABC transporter, permease protein 1 (cluster 4, leucine/isoleucine/valine/benzoate) / ABC transporter, permease protein 2 (cluster 4, leucine/isoleucine/valine/benzoate) [uncultured Craurococcus sp.]